jgi:hypothetical protein
MSGSQTFFPNPSKIRINPYDPKYVVLTPVDDIDGSFLLLVFDSYGSDLRVHTAQ